MIGDHLLQLIYNIVLGKIDFLAHIRESHIFDHHLADRGLDYLESAVELFERVGQPGEFFENVCQFCIAVKFNKVTSAIFRLSIFRFALTRRFRSRLQRALYPALRFCTAYLLRL